MSVAHLETRELATFVAIASARCKAGTLGELAEMAAMMSRSNSAAYTSQYGDYAEPSEAEEIEVEALRLLAADDLTAHFGPIVYNCVTNAGHLYYGDLPADATQTDIGREVAHWRKVEDEARKWQEGQARKLHRAEQNAVAFDEVGRLPMKSADELKQIMGDGALIIAEFRVSECDSQSDYWGGRTGRRVVIGVRKGKRESFKALRKAAGNFPPTSNYGPDKDVYTARVVLQNDIPNCNGAAYWKGSSSHWHNDIGHGKQFETRAEAEAFVAAAGSPHDLGMGNGLVGIFVWEIHCESIEHRENYSMGGGNYLGNNRYGGWVVSSESYATAPMEVWKL
jgi:hypothetical protein